MLTLSRVRNGADPQPYEGGRTAETIVEYVKRKSSPPSLEAADCDAMHKYIDENRLALAYFGEFTGELWEAYTSLPKVDSLSMIYDFFHTKDPACGEKYGLQGEGLLLHRTFDGDNLVYSGDKTPDEV